MRSFRKISIKKPSALLFMAMMVFISIVKLFHSHPGLESSYSSSPANSNVAKSKFSLHQVSQNNHCPICDFNLMKNADLTHSDISPFIRVSGNAVFSSLLPKSLHQFSVPCKGRAPPVFFS